MTDHSNTLLDDADGAVPVHAAGPDDLAGMFAALTSAERRFAQAQGFAGEAGRVLVLPDARGEIGRVLFGLGAAGERTALVYGRLATGLPPGEYRLADAPGEADLAALAFALGGYRFDSYRKPRDPGAQLALPAGSDAQMVAAIRDGVFLARDLVNTPANDLGPRELADAAAALAGRFDAAIDVVDGADLARGFPMIHAVGAASDRPPCLVDMRWGDAAHPKVTLIGKGIVFDTGGLDIKPASGMALMKKDMGGAANVLGLASMIMQAKLPVRLRVLIPAAENAISGCAFRPGDVLRSRKGLSVEIGNTDAEGRLVLADAMALADEEAPDLMVTMATLTGAARVALGPDLPPFYTDDDDFAAALGAAATAVHDPLWRMPLWRPYDAWLSSKIADVNHISGNAHAGSIVAALFLRRFVESAKTFAHFDIFAWNPSPRAWGPEGGEAQGIRALFQHLRQVHAPR